MRERDEPDGGGHDRAGGEDPQHGDDQIAGEEAADLALEREGQHGEVDQRGDRRAERQADVAEAAEGEHVPGRLAATAVTLAMSGTRVRPSA